MATAKAPARAPKKTKPVPAVREAKDARDSAALRADPSDEDAKADIASDESFPASDAPAQSPGDGEPAPSSGYDAAAEARLEKIRVRAHQIWESEGHPHGRHDDHWAQATRDIDTAAKPKRAPRKK